MQVQKVQYNNNYNTNFTATRYPDDTVIIGKMGESLGKNFIAKKPEIDKLSQEYNTDFEFTLDDNDFFNVYAGEFQSKPWQTENYGVAQYIHPSEPVRWQRKEYYLKADGAEENIENSLMNDLILLANNFQVHKERAERK